VDARAEKKMFGVIIGESCKCTPKRREKSLWGKFMLGAAELQG